MIKAKLVGEDARPMFLLGLSEGNVKLLKQGRPIVVHLDSIGGPACDVTICYGETEEKIQDEVIGALGVPKFYVNTKERQ